MLVEMASLAHFNQGAAHLTRGTIYCLHESHSKTAYYLQDNPDVPDAHTSGVIRCWRGCASDARRHNNGSAITRDGVTAAGPWGE